MERVYLHGVAHVKKSGDTLYIASEGGGVVDEKSVVATGSDTPRTLADRFADVVNVKDFGAVGDGEHDDTEAIQKALNAGIGKTVFFPIGEYIVSPDVTFIVSSNTKIVGYSCENTKITTLKTSSLLPYMFLIEGNDVSFYGLRFDGGRIESEKDALHGRQGLIWYGNVYGYSGLKVDSCYIHDFCSRTIYSLANNTIVYRNRIERCSLFNADLSSMRGVVTNWYDSSSDAKTMNNVIVENNHFIECGHFASFGEDGIHVSATSLCAGVSISNNTITEIKNLYNKDICTGVFLGTGAANISQVRVNNNNIFNKDNEESGILEKLFTHGIYFGFDNIISDPSFCGLSTFEIKGNFLNGYRDASIGFDSRCYTSGAARHFRAISENRCGGHSGTSGLIADVQNRNWAMEFVSEEQPTAGNYVIGDRVLRAFPSQNPIGWVCIATGSPGTWREIQYTIPS